ncbi:MAG TPA: prephenate dehydratase [Anaerolineaceae bacterium]|nr:prephenate dehydratase [Anaerolineaceae bacterium]
MRISYQGEPGAYSEAAVFEHFGSAAAADPCKSFEDVFQRVVQGDSQYGFIPIENSLAGSIHQNYDLLLQHPLSVVGERYLYVKHCLIGMPGVRLDEIRKVISHPQALAQCAVYIRSLPGVTAEPVYDTAGSVKIASELRDRSLAAIASRRAAGLYGMAILAENIQDNPENITRFLVIGQEPAVPEGEAKTSIVFSLKNVPGSLFRAMSVFALRDIDLTKIESRPLIGRPWEYLFYIDFAGSTLDPVVERALAHLSEYALMLRVLGSYPRHRL